MSLIREDLNALTPHLNNEQAFDGEWVEMTTHFGCCDCGLVHQMEWRVKTPEGYVIVFPPGVNLEMRTFRDKEATEAARSGGNWICQIDKKEKR